MTQTQATTPTSSTPSHTPGRIGPNSVIRVAEALEAVQDRASVEKLLRAAGLDAYVSAMPEQMIDEREVARLHRALREQLGVEAAQKIARDAGWRTGDYLLARRIPKPAQRILKLLPARLASRALLAAIRRNAWTFAGSGIFAATPAYPPRITITGGPVCAGETIERTLCDFYAGTFERLYRELVHPQARVGKSDATSPTDDCCAFELHW